MKIIPKLSKKSVAVQNVGLMLLRTGRQQQILAVAFQQLVPVGLSGG
jgi:hypothetical protein